MVDADFVLHPQLAADSLLLTEWPLSQVRLINDQQYPWFLLVPKVTAAKDIIDLTDEQQLQFWQESKLLSHWIRSDYQPDKLNIAALGNVVAQLHLHHIGRFKSDMAWPAPVWGKHPARPYSTELLTILMERWQQRSFV
jgi:diadenosine tetraphosphate (Ap4A) HIT family hydrolase